jgi:alpha-ketoglutarate-dependent taurine dioxygenase
MQIRNALFPGGVVREVTYKPAPGSQDTQHEDGGNSRHAGNEDERGCHTDSMGKRMPDFIVLACAGAAKAGGENFIVDLYAVIDAIGADPSTAWMASALSERDVISVNNNTTSRATDLWLGPIAPEAVAKPPSGQQWDRVHGRACRRIAQGRQTFGVLPGTPAEEAERDAAMAMTYKRAVDEAQAAAPRFRCEAGDCLLMDNFRCAHGRAGYTEDYRAQVEQVGQEPLGVEEALLAGHRLLWRLWIWTVPWPGAAKSWSSLTAQGGDRCPEGVDMTESRGLDVDGGDGNYRGDVMQIIEGDNGQAAGFKLRSVADFYVVEQDGEGCLKDASRPTHRM